MSWGYARFFSFEGGIFFRHQHQGSVLCEATVLCEASFCRYRARSRSRGEASISICTSLLRMRRRERPFTRTPTSTNLGVAACFGLAVARALNETSFRLVVSPLYLMVHDSSSSSRGRSSTRGPTLFFLGAPPPGHAVLRPASWSTLLSLPSLILGSVGPNAFLPSTRPSAWQPLPGKPSCVAVGLAEGAGFWTCRVMQSGV